MRKNLCSLLSVFALTVAAAPVFADNHNEGKATKEAGKKCTECTKCKHKKGEACDCGHDKACSEKSGKSAGKGEKGHEGHGH